MHNMHWSSSPSLLSYTHTHILIRVKNKLYKWKKTIDTVDIILYQLVWSLVNLCINKYTVFGCKVLP